MQSDQISNPTVLIHERRTHQRTPKDIQTKDGHQFHTTPGRGLGNDRRRERRIKPLELDLEEAHNQSTTGGLEMRKESYSYQTWCKHCGKPFRCSRRHKLSCSPRCKKALQRTRLRGQTNQVKQQWPQDLEVIWENPKGGRKPGKVDWQFCDMAEGPLAEFQIPVNLGFSWQVCHPANLLRMDRRRKTPV